MCRVPQLTSSKTHHRTTYTTSRATTNTSFRITHSITSHRLVIATSRTTFRATFRTTSHLPSHIASRLISQGMVRTTSRLTFHTTFRVAECRTTHRTAHRMDHEMNPLISRYGFIYLQAFHASQLIHPFIVKRRVLLTRGIPCARELYVATLSLQVFLVLDVSRRKSR